jgi:hypothetical protein
MSRDGADWPNRGQTLQGIAAGSVSLGFVTAAEAAGNDGPFANNGNGPPDVSGDGDVWGGSPGDHRYVVVTASKPAKAVTRGLADVVHCELD